jgi:DMSO reductase anchor subunit
MKTKYKFITRKTVHVRFNIYLNIFLPTIHSYFSFIILYLSMHIAAPLLWYIQAGKQDTKAFGEAMFISMLAVTQWIPIQRLSPENTEALPFIHLQTKNRNEKQSLTHIWLPVISLVTSFSMLCDHFQVQFLLSFSFRPCLPLLPTT